MDLRLLEIFCRVFTHRSFSAAARELQLSQPTVSTHIKELEESLGTPVFNRLGREIEPTEAGNLLYERAKAIVALKRDVTETMAGFLNRVEGILTVGASSVPGECLLPGLLTGFHARHADVRLRLRITDTAETLDALRHGDIELGVVGGTVDDDDLQFAPLASDALVLAVPPASVWTRGTQFTLRQLRELPLLVREGGSGTRTVLERTLAQRKLGLSDLKIAAELGSLGAIREAVKQGYGVSFLSELAIRSEVDGGLVRVGRVAGLGAIPRTYYTVLSRRRTLSPLTRAFAGYLRDTPAPAKPSGGTRRRGHER